MSYCRFGKDSDVYMYPSMNIICCACRITPEKFPDGSEWYGNPEFATAEDALFHLRKHRAAGYKVPFYAVRRLRKELPYDLVDETKGYFRLG